MLGIRLGARLVRGAAPLASWLSEQPPSRGDKINCERVDEVGNATPSSRHVSYPGSSQVGNHSKNTRPARPDRVAFAMGTDSEVQSPSADRLFALARTCLRE